jgi:hypothetical protein
MYFREPYDKNPVLISTLSVIKCRHAAMDLVRVETKCQVRMLDVCLFRGKGMVRVKISGSHGNAY